MRKVFLASSTHRSTGAVAAPRAAPNNVNRLDNDTNGAFPDSVPESSPFPVQSPHRNRYDSKPSSNGIQNMTGTGGGGGSGSY